MKYLANTVQVPLFIKDLKIKNIKWEHGIYLEEIQGTEEDEFNCRLIDFGVLKCFDGVERFLNRWKFKRPGSKFYHWNLNETNEFTCDINEDGKIEYCYIFDLKL